MGVVIGLALLAALAAQADGAGLRPALALDGAHVATVSAVRPGARFRVQATPIVCGVRAGGGAVSVDCALHSLTSPPPGSYRIAVSDRRAAIETSAGRAVKSVAEPSPAAAATFAGTSGPPSTVTFATGTELEIGGSHLLCEIRRYHGAIYVICGIAVTSTPGAGVEEVSYATGSDLVVIAMNYVDLERFERGNRETSIAYEPQP